MNASEWRRAYEAGATVEELALSTGHSPQTIRNELKAAGTKMRRPGERAGVDRRPGPRSGDINAPLRDPAARIARPSVARFFR